MIGHKKGGGRLTSRSSLLQIHNFSIAIILEKFLIKYLNNNINLGLV